MPMFPEHSFGLFNACELKNGLALKIFEWPTNFIPLGLTFLGEFFKIQSWGKEVFLSSLSCLSP